MAEEVNYASVVFKAKKNSPREDKKKEETVYDDVKVRRQTTEQTGDTNAGILPDKREKRCQQLACCLGILCVILLLGIITVCVYLTTSHRSEQNQFKETLLAVNRNLTNLNHKLRSENEKLRRDHHNLTVQVGNLTQDYRVLESKIKNRTEENRNLTTQNQQLKAQNQELETQKNNLTEQIQDMGTKRNEFNVSRAQWSIDVYCPGRRNQRRCKPCQRGWSHFQSSCFAINDAGSDHQKTWDEAREDCRGKISDLAVIDNQEEKTFISKNSWGSSGTNGYWIGLRVEDGRWKWVDGTDLTEDSWIQQRPPTDGHCAFSVKNERWESVNCTEKKMWICKKAALSV